MKLFTKTLPALVISSLFIGCGATDNSQNIKNDESNDKVKNIIMIVADGMGPVYPAAYRYFNDDPNTAAIEETVFDRHYTGSVTTYPAPVSGYVTDSAAGATALASGIKSYNGAIGVDVNKKQVDSVLQKAKDAGLKTGIVVTSQVNHATPASYISHNESRRNYNEIADSYIDFGINTDVLLGGGTDYFIRKERNLVSEYQDAGFHYINNYQQLDAAPTDKPLLGLFAPIGLPWALDDSNRHRLSTMVKTATKHLENDNGYFLMVEASQVDWAGHANDVSSAMAEMDDLAKTLEYLERYVANNPETLVVLTADHSTGGISIAANGVYKWEPQSIRKFDRSVTNMAKEFIKDDVTAKQLTTWLHADITDEEYKNVVSAKDNGLIELANYNKLSDIEKKSARKPNVTRMVSKMINKIVDRQTNTGWTSGGHTAVDVPLYSFGASSQHFTGSIDNTDVAKKIFSLLKE